MDNAKYSSSENASSSSSSSTAYASASASSASHADRSSDINQSQSDGEILFSGYLTKRSQWLKEWRKRYVVLRQKKIYFMKSPTEQPHDQVNVNEIISIRSADDKTGKQHSFEITTSEASYFLFAETDKEKDSWIGAIGRAIVQLSKAYVRKAMRNVLSSASKTRRGGMLMPIGIAGASIATVGFTYDHFFGGDVAVRSGRTILGALRTLYRYKTIDESIIDLDEIHTQVANDWYHICSTNAGLYTKIGQQISSMNHILPSSFLVPFSKLQDKAPTIPHEEVNKVFKEEFGKLPNEIFSQFDFNPIASASIAQVHCATLKDGKTKVAVKVQKPEIAKQIDADLFMYRLLNFCIEFAFDIPVSWMAPKLISELKKEVDFTVEATNSKIAKEQLRDMVDSGDLHIPDVIDELTTKRVLTMEFVDGIRITDKKSIEEKLNLDTTQAMHLLVDYLSLQVFRNGFVHCDLHPGNVLVRAHPSGSSRKPQLIVLDHGLYCKISEELRKSYARLWKAMILFDTDELVHIATSWGVNEADVDLFASFQLFRPYANNNIKKSGDNQHQALSTSRAMASGLPPSKAEVVQMQLRAKERFKKLLADSSKTPPELSLIGRSMNLVRASNKALNSPVNRIEILARHAARACAVMDKTNLKSNNIVSSSQLLDHNTNTIANLSWKDQITSSWETFDFELRLFFLSFFFRTEQLLGWIKKIVFPNLSDDGGFEARLDSQIGNTIEAQFGFKVNLNDGGLG